MTANETHLNTDADNKSQTKFANNRSEFEQLMQNYRLSFNKQVADIQAAMNKMIGLKLNL